MKIFTYGALMSSKYMEEIGVDSSTRRRATLHDYELKFEKQASDNPLKGFATIIPSQGKKVYGLIYDIHEKSLAILDKIEDYPHGYSREKIMVETPDDPHLQAIAYIATPAFIKKDLLPTEDYIRKLLESEDLLPPDYISWLKQLPTLPQP